MFVTIGQYFHLPASASPLQSRADKKYPIRIGSSVTVPLGQTPRERLSQRRGTDVGADYTNR
jgi:hypothetical protein